MSPINFPTAASIAHIVVDTAKEQECDEVALVYNRFKNVLSQEVTRTLIMSRETFLKQFKYITRHEATEPDLEYSKNYFYDLYLASIFYNAFLNGNASE